MVLKVIFDGHNCHTIKIVVFLFSSIDSDNSQNMKTNYMTMNKDTNYII